MKVGDVLDSVTDMALQSLGQIGRECISNTDHLCFHDGHVYRFARYRESLLPEYLFRAPQCDRFVMWSKVMCVGTLTKELHRKQRVAGSACDEREVSPIPRHSVFRPFAYSPT